VVHGARVSLKVGFVAVGIATALGLLVGLLSGFYGGWVDSVLMRIVDMMLCFPTFFLILSVIAFLEPSIWNIMAVIGLTGWMGVARLVRAETLSLKERDFVAAARRRGPATRGSSSATSSPTRWRRSWWRPRSGWRGDPHRVRAFLPRDRRAAADPVVGEHPHLGEGQHRVRWWLSLFPGLAILVTVLGYNLLGEGIRDAADPRLKGR